MADRTKVMDEIVAALRSRSAALAQRWFHAIYDGSDGLPHSQAIQADLLALTHRLVAITTQPIIPLREAESIGAAFADFANLSLESLGRTIALLIDEMKVLSPDQRIHVLPRFTHVLSRFTMGYEAQMHKTTPSDQAPRSLAMEMESRVEEQTQEAHARLKEQMQERTAELAAATVRLRAELQRRENAEMAYRALVENSPQGLIIFQNERIVFANNILSHLTGYPLDELLAMSSTDLLSLVDEEDYDRIFARYRHPAPKAHYEARCRRYDGTPYWVEVYASDIIFNSAPARQAVIIDITERKLAEQEQQRSELRYRLLLDLTPDLVLAHTDGKVVFANQVAARTFGAMTPEALIGRPVLDLTHPDYREIHRQRLNQLRIGDKLPPVETKLPDPDSGSVHDFELRTAIIDYRGKPTILVVGRNITQRKLAEAALREAHNSLEQRVQERTAELARANEALQEEIRHRERAEIALRERNRHLDVLNEASRAFAASLELEDVLTVVLERLRDVLEANGWFVWLCDDTSAGDGRVSSVVCEHCTTPDGTDMKGCRAPADRGLLGWVLTQQRSIRLADITESQIAAEDRARLEAMGVRSVLAVPLKVQERTIGVIEVLDGERDSFDAADLTLLELLAASAAIAIDNARLYKAAQHEIIERRRAEHALRESEGRYRTLVEASPDAIVVTDLDGLIQMSNRRARELMGMSDSTTSPGVDVLEAYVVPEERHRARRTLERLRREGGIQSVEQRLQRRDGTIFTAEVNVTVLRNGTGQPDGLVAIARDLTHRERIENALRRSNAELKALNAIALRTDRTANVRDLLDTAICQIRDLTAVRVSWVHLAGPRRDEGPITVVVAEQHDDPPLRETMTARVQTTGLALAARVPNETYLATMGETTWSPDATFAAVGLPIRVQQRTVGALGVIGSGIDSQDVNFLEAVARQISIAAENAHLARSAAEVTLLRSLDKLRSELVANFSHDLKTPLGIIKFSCTTLMRDDVIFDRKTQMELLRDIDAQADQLEHIVERVLELGRLESDNLQLNRARVDIAALTARTVASVGRGLQRHRLLHDFDPTPLIVDADGKRVEEVLLNLLDNAVKYMPDGGDINVVGRLHEGCVVISITDSGIGIPQQDLTRIFERFYRVDSKLRPHTAGVGLGLAVCRGIVEAHGGEIWAESTIDVGTTIRFTLPAVLDA